MIRKTAILFYLLTLFSLPFANVYYVDILNQRVLITEVLFLITSVIFLLALAKKQITFKLGRFYLPLIAYLFATSLSTLFSPELTKSGVKLAGIVYLIGLAVLSFNLVCDSDVVRKVCKVWLAASLITSLVAIVTLVLFYIDRQNWFLVYTLSHYGTLPAGNYPRIQSTFFNPNLYCHYLTVSWMVLLLSWRMGWVRKWLLIILSICFTVATAFTISPGLGGIILAVGLWSFLVYSKAERKLLARAALFATITGSVLFIGISSLTIGFTDSTGSDRGVYFSPSVRVLTWESAAKNFMANPLVGKGLGTNAAMVEYVTTNGMRQRLGDAHNMFLNVAAESGFPGLISLLFLGLYFVKRILPFSLDADETTIRTAFGIAFLSCFFYQGLVGSYEDARHLWMLIGVLATVCRVRFVAVSDETLSESAQ